MVTELFVFFIIAPAIVYILVPFPVLLILWLFALLCRYALIKDPEFDRTSLWRASALSSSIRLILLRFIIYSALLFAMVYVWKPELLFNLIKQRPSLWVLIIFLYPLLSVYPQEIIYRAYFFHRYRSLFPGRWLFIAVNAFLFGYMHIIFHNWVAVILTGVGGLLFALTYNRSRSILLVSIEHSLLGCSIFTIGLGQFFYNGSVGAISQGLRL